MTRTGILPVLLALVALVAACQTDALTGRSTFNLYTYDDEKRMGDAAVQPILAELGGLYPDRALQAYVDGIGQKVVAAGRTRLREGADFPNWDFKFYVVNSSMINAFALPGGHVFVTRGILLRMNDEAELAGLLGHEVAHVFARHSVERISKMQAMILPVALLGAFEETQGAAVVGVVAVQLLSLKYSRSDESESDAFGMRFAARAGYHPDGVIGVMRMLGDHSRAHGGSPPEFLSTHPDPGNRVQELTAQLNKEYPDAAQGAYVRNQPQWQRGLVEVRATQPAYELADQGDAIMTAAFKQWESNPAAARNEIRRALGLYQGAVARRRDHALLHVNVAQAQFYLEDYNAAEQAVAQALRLEGNTFWPNFMGGMIALKRDNHAAAQSRLRAALALIPDSPVGLFYLAVACDRGNQPQPAIENYTKAWNAFGGQGDLAERARTRLIELGQPDPKR